MNTSRREWLKQSSFAAFGLGLSLKSMGNEEGLLRSFGKDQGLINLGSNENPYGISPMAKQAIMEQISESNRYQYNVNGVKDFNARSIHIAYIGGIDSNNQPEDNRSEAQQHAMYNLLQELTEKYPFAKLMGHRDFPNVARACPSFDVDTWWKEYKKIHEAEFAKRA